MSTVKQVLLYGFKLSPYCAIVDHALRLKGVPYKYIDEDLSRKSATLLRLNPIYRKVPVLVVDGKAISESLLIMEFIDETWKENSPPLLPEDPYKRAKTRFWADFIYKKLVPVISVMRRARGEALAAATEEFIEVLKTLEWGMKSELWSGAGPFINGDKPGLVDVILGSCQAQFTVLGEIAGVELLDKERTPLLCSIVSAYAELEELKDVTVAPEKLLEKLQASRKMT